MNSGAEVDGELKTDSIGWGIVIGLILFIMLPMSLFDRGEFLKDVWNHATTKTRISAILTFVISVALIYGFIVMVGYNYKQQELEAYNQYLAGLNQTVAVTDGMTLSLIDYRYIDIQTDLTQFENAKVRMLMNERSDTLFDTEIWKEWVLEKKITKKTFRFDTQYVANPLIFIEIEKPDSFMQHTYRIRSWPMYITTPYVNESGWKPVKVLEV